jgi:hypothetical protein
MRAILIFFLSFILASCDKGLSPEFADEKSGFGGTITFSGEWDPTIIQTHVVVFKDPLLSVADFNVFNLSYVSDLIPNGSQSYEYSTFDDNSLISTIEAGYYSYIAVAQSLRDSITLNRDDWRVVGLYYAEGSTTLPGTLILPEASFIENIDIHCDFDNPPPQPP